MIIAIENIPNLLENPDKLRAFNNLLAAHGEGKHVLWMPSKKAEEIISMGIVYGYNLKVLHAIRDNSRISRSIIDDFDFYVDADFVNEAGYKFCPPKKFKIGYRHFVDSAGIQPSVFIAENIIDINFYERGSHVYLKEKKLFAAYKSIFTKVPGGGNTTIDSFEYHVERKNLLLCILDSDKKHPAQGLQDTARRFAGYSAGWGEGYWLHILECTEAENIVPWRVAELALANERETTRIQFLKLSPAARQYLDHKKGMKIGEGLQMDSTHKSPHWGAVISQDDDADDWICEPLGPKFLEKCVRLMVESSPKKLLELMDDEKDVGYMALARMVASWGIALKSPIRS